MAAAVTKLHLAGSAAPPDRMLPAVADRVGALVAAEEAEDVLGELALERGVGHVLPGDAQGDPAPGGETTVPAAVAPPRLPRAVDDAPVALDAEHLPGRARPGGPWAA